MSNGQSIPKVTKVRVNPQLPGIPKGFDLLGLTGQVLLFAVLHLAFARAHLPVGAKLNPIGRVHVDHLHLALQGLFLRQGGHHQQAVAQDHAVGPVLLVMVKIHQLFKGNVVEIVEERQLLLRLFFLRLFTHILDDGLGTDLLLDIDGHRRHFQGMLVLLILAFPDQLRVERGIAWVEDGLRRLFFIGHKVAQFLGGDVGALVRVAGGGDGGGSILIRLAWRHLSFPPGAVRLSMAGNKFAATATRCRLLCMNKNLDSPITHGPSNYES